MHSFVTAGGLGGASTEDLRRHREEVTAKTMGVRTMGRKAERNKINPTLAATMGAK